MVKINKLLILLQLLLLNAIENTQSAARINTNNVANELDLKLIYAAQHGDKDKVIQLIRNGANVNAVDIWKDTALIWAAANGHKEIVELLIKANADINAADKWGYIALMWAAVRWHHEIVRLLIKYNANMNAVDNNERTTLMRVSCDGHKEIVELLLLSGADIEHKNKQGDRAIEIARVNNRHDLVKMLEGEPARRDAVIKKWIKDKLSPKITEATSDLLFLDLSNLIGQYAVEYTDIPLEYKLDS